jgi:hypothetical protein
MKSTGTLKQKCKWKSYLQFLAVDLTSDGRDSSRRIPASGIGALARWRHCRRQEARRSSQIESYGPPFTKPKAQGDKGALHELTQGKNKGQEEVGVACSGGGSNLNSASGLRGKDGFPWCVDGKGGGKGGSRDFIGGLVDLHTEKIPVK